MTDSEIRDYFHSAKVFVDSCGFKNEYEQQRSIIGKEWSESDFLREYSWVVLSSGFSEAVVRARFSFVSLAFFDFVSAEKIIENGKECAELALIAINHKSKVAGILRTASIIKELGFSIFHQKVIRERNDYLETLPFIGRLTSEHLLKNLGYDVAKGDRHLQRTCSKFGFEEAGAFCRHVSELTGEPIAVIDIILWRFAVLKTRNKRFNSKPHRHLLRDHHQDSQVMGVIGG